MKKYFYEIDGMVEGPVERSELDYTDPDLSICLEGTQDWFPLSAIDQDRFSLGEILSTGGVGWEHVIVDAIFAFDSHSEGFLRSCDPGTAFDGVKGKLRAICKRMRGDAVINCHFEYRNAVEGGFFGKAQSIEIFAYGTVVRKV